MITATNNEIATLVEAIKADYAIGNWRDEMINRFNSNITIEEGRKYIKILTDRSVWGFIVKGEDKLFREGDILKAASFNAPARNKPRGNILDGGYDIRWTGPNYL